MESGLPARLLGPKEAPNEEVGLSIAPMDCGIGKQNLGGGLAVHHDENRIAAGSYVPWTRSWLVGCERTA